MMKAVCFSAVLALCLAMVSAQKGASLPCGMTVGNDVYDFSALKRTSGPYKVSDADMNYYYVFNVCGNVTNSSTTCAGSICQFATSGGFVSTVAEWSEADGGVTWALEEGSPSAQTANGDACFPSAQPRQASIDFVCDEDNEVGDLAVFESACSYTITFPTKYACVAATLPCSVPLKGHNYSFAALTQETGYYAVNSTGGLYVYKFNICGNIAGDSQCNGAICQYEYSNNEFVSAISHWSTANGGALWTAESNNFALQTMNGDLCFPSAQPRTATIDFVCDKAHTVGTLAINETTTCDYVITFPTKLACSS